MKLTVLPLPFRCVFYSVFKCHEQFLLSLRNVEKLHSLLDRLLTEGSEGKGVKVQTDTSTEPQAGQTTNVESPAAAKSKELAGTVDELHSLMDDQKGLISQLITELSASEKENSLLKNQVNKNH